MKKTTTNAKWFLAAAVALMCLAPCAIAQETLTLKGVEGGYDAYGFGSGPYSIQVGTGASYNMICDDFTDEIQIGDYWTATPLRVNGTGSNITSALFGSQAGALTEYEEAAYLSYAILFNTGLGGYSNDNLQLAVWAIFNSASVKNVVCGATCSGAGLTEWNLIQTIISTYASSGTLNLLQAFTIWTPVPGTCSGSAGCSGQEFFQYVPEGGAALLYLLLAVGSCAGAMFLRSRDKGSRRAIA